MEAGKYIPASIIFFLLFSSHYSLKTIIGNDVDVVDIYILFYVFNFIDIVGWNSGRN